MGTPEARKATAAEKAQILTAIEEVLHNNAQIDDDQQEIGRVTTGASAGNITGTSPTHGEFAMGVRAGAMVARGNGDGANGMWDNNQFDITVTSNANIGSAPVSGPMIGLGESHKTHEALYENDLSTALLSEIAQTAGLSDTTSPTESHVMESGTFGTSLVRHPYSFSVHLHAHKGDLAKVTEAVTALKEQYMAEAPKLAGNVTAAAEVQGEVQRGKT